jgi:hypothetical protein
VHRHHERRIYLPQHLHDVEGAQRQRRAHQRQASTWSTCVGRAPEGSRAEQCRGAMYPTANSRPIPVPDSGKGSLAVRLHELYVRAGPIRLAVHPHPRLVPYLGGLLEPAEKLFC